MDNAQEIRMECLRLAMSATRTSTQVVLAAEEYEKFVTGSNDESS